MILPPSSLSFAFLTPRFPHFPLAHATGHDSSFMIRFTISSGKTRQVMVMCSSDQLQRNPVAGLGLPSGFLKNFQQLSVTFVFGQRDLNKLILSTRSVTPRYLWTAPLQITSSRAVWTTTCFTNYICCDRRSFT